MISKSIFRYSFLPTNVTIVLEHAREVDALHMISCGIPPEKSFVADGAVAVWNANSLHKIFADKLVEFFRVGKILSKLKMSCICIMIKSSTLIILNR